MGLFKYGKSENLTYQLADDSELFSGAVDDGEGWLVFAGRLLGEALRQLERERFGIRSWVFILQSGCRLVSGVRTYLRAF